MLKKYLVYISSTMDDLKAERRELIRVVSELGAIPVTMDAFSIGLEDERRLIKKVIEECDYFISLTAFKAGEAVGKSFALETEYSHALKAKVPVLALIISPKARWKNTKKEKNAATAKSLEAFKKKLQDNTYDTWMNLGDLRQKALSLLSREMNLNTRPGWAPSTDVADPSVANVLSRLIQENETLRNRLKMEGTDINKRVRQHIKHAIKMLATNKISLSFYYTDGNNWENTQVVKYIKLFRLLTPELSVPKTVLEISHFLGHILNPNLEKTVRKEYPTPSNTIKKIMTDFVLLKLVKRTETGGTEAWKMTEYGKEAFAVLRLKQMTRTQEKK